MSPNTLIKIPFAANRDPIVLDWFRRQTRAIGFGFDKRLIYLAASDSRARWVQALLAREVGVVPETLFGTIDGVVSRLASRVDLPGKSARSSILREHLRSAAMEALSKEGSSRRPSRLWVDQIAAALSRVAVCFAPEHRDSELQRLEIEARNADDLALEKRLVFLREVQRAYTQRLDEAGLIDESDLEWLYLPRIEQVLEGVQGILIDDIYRIAPAQRRLLEKVVSYDGVETTILLRSSSGESHVEAATSSFREWLPGSLLPSEVDDAESEPADVSRAFLDTERLEARCIVAAVKRAYGSGTKLSELGVSMVTHDQQKRVINALEFNGVPVTTHLEEPLRLMPLVDGVMRLLRVVAEGAEREEVLAALRSPWLRGLGDSCKELLSQGKYPLSWTGFIDRLTFIVRKAGVVGGVAGQDLASSWIQGLEALREFITKEKSEEEQKEFGYSGVFDSDIPLIDAAILLLNQINQLLRAPRQELVGRLLSFVDSLSLAKVLYKVFDRAGLKGESQRQVHAISLSQFEDTLSAFARVDADFGGNEICSLAALLDDIEDELASVLVRPRKDVDGVYVGGLLDARELNFPHLIVGGLNDGELPFNLPENLYLPSRIRDLAKHLGEVERDTLAGEASPLSLYRHLFASALGAGRKSVLLTMPKMVGGGEVEPSLPFREEMMQAGVDPKRLAKERHLSESIGAADAQEWLAATTSSDLNLLESASNPETPWQLRALQGASVNRQRDDLGLLISAYEGGLSGHANKLAQRFRPEGEAPFISNSSLESYALCPLRYYFKEVIGLSEEDRPEDDVSPLDRGSLIHDTLEAFFLEVRRVINQSDQGVYLDDSEVESPQGIALDTLPLLDLALYEILCGKSSSETLRESFQKIAATYNYPSTSWQQWLARIDASLVEDSEFVSELSIFLDYEREGQMRGVFPWLLEYGFGDGAETSGPPYLIRDRQGRDRMKIRGYIDRVDVLIDEDGTPKGFVVRDYKVSKSSKRKELVEGVRFQLPIYTAAVGEHFSGLANLGFFYQLITLNDKLGVDAPTMSKDTIAQVRGSSRIKVIPPESMSAEVVSDKIVAIESAMEAGRFHPTLVRGEASCDYCSFSRICTKRSLKILAHSQSSAHLAEIQAYVPNLIEGASDAE